MHEQEERVDDTLIPRSNNGRLHYHGKCCMCCTLRGLVSDETIDADDGADGDGETTNILVAESKYNHVKTLYLLCLISCLLIVNLFYVQQLLLQHSTQT
jgi:hypothetical protein